MFIGFKKKPFMCWRASASGKWATKLSAPHRGHTSSFRRGVPHNIANASDKPARMIMTVSPPGHEHYFEELVILVARSNPPDANAIAELRSRYDTEQLSALKAS